MKKATQTTLTLYAYDPTTGEPATGLTAASVTTCISKDGATPTQTTNSVAEVSSSILPGWYRLTLTASETDCDTALVTATHATAKFATCELEFQPNDYATATNLTTLQTHGDSEWATASGFAVAGDAMTLTAAYDAAKTSVDVETVLTSYGAAKTTDVPSIASVQSGLATSADLTALQTHGDSAWVGASTAEVAQAVLTTPADNGKANTLQNALRGILGTWSLVDDTLLIKTTEGVTALALTVTRNDTGDITGGTI